MFLQAAWAQKTALSPPIPRYCACPASLGRYPPGNGGPPRWRLKKACTKSHCGWDRAVIFFSFHHAIAMKRKIIRVPMPAGPNTSETMRLA